MTADLYDCGLAIEIADCRFVDCNPKSSRRNLPRPGEPAAHVRICLALLPSGPDAVRRLRLHRDRAAIRPAVAGNLPGAANFKCTTACRLSSPWTSPANVIKPDARGRGGD